MVTLSGLNSSGDIYLAGAFFEFSTFGTITLTAAGGLDGFLTKLNSDGDILWAKQISGDQWENALSVALDGNENCYVAGYFAGTANFGATTMVSGGLEDIFLAKYNSSGSLIMGEKSRKQ